MTFSTDALIPPHASNPRIVKLDCFVSNPRKAACSAWVANRRQMCTTRNGAHAISCKFLGGPALYNATGMVLTTPTPKASEIRAILESYDTVFALGGKSLITILYSEGPAVPSACKVFQLSSDVRDLGRTYATELSCMGDIKASLTVLLPMLDRKLARRRGAIAALREKAATDREARRAALRDRAKSESVAPSDDTLRGGRVRAIGPHVAIVDEAPATMVSVRSLLESSSARQYSACRGGGLGWGMPAAVGWSLGLDRQPVMSLVGDGSSMYSPQALWTAAYEGLP